MRHFLFGVRLFAVVAALLVVGAAPFQATTGLVGHWKLDEASSATVADDATTLTVTATDGTYLGNSTQALGNVPAAMAAYPDPASRLFDGNGDYVSVPDRAALQLPGDMTIAFWVYKNTPEPTDWVRLVGKGAGNNRNYGVWDHPGTGGQILFQLYGAAGVNMSSTGSVVPNVWTHVTARISAATASIHLDGAPSGTAAKNGAAVVSADPVTIGYAPGLHTYHNGLLDDVRIYNRALTDAEIQILYTGLPGASGVTVVPGPQELTISWTAAPSPASGYTLLKGTTPTNLAPYQTGLTGTSYVDNVVSFGVTYYYAVIANLSVGESAISPIASGVPDTVLPRYNDHEEGGKDGNCACGSAGDSGLSFILACSVLLLLTLALRR